MVDVYVIIHSEFSLMTMDVAHTGLTTYFQHLLAISRVIILMQC